MHNHLDEHTRYLVSALFRYTQSLESGDLEGVVDILRQAEQDPVLERLLLEINEVYQAADASSVSPIEFARVQNFLTSLLEQETNLKSNGRGPQVEQKLMLSGWQHDSQERRPEIMKDSVNTAPTAEDSPLQDESNHPVHPPVRKRRLTHFMQMLAATLVVGALLAGFLTLLGSRHPDTPGGPVSSASSVVALNSSGGTVYALRPSDGAELWHYATGIVDTTLGSDTSLAVLNHVVYFSVRGRVFAFQDTTGKLLWQQNILPASTHVFGSTSYSFALDGNVLLVSLVNYDGGAESSVLFALSATTGNVLWHQDTDYQYLMIASHGIVYTSTLGTSEANPGMLKALRVTDGKVLWRNTDQSFTPVNILITDNVLYMQADVSDPPVSNRAQSHESLFALNAHTGAFIWSREIQKADAEVGGDMGQMLSENGMIVLYNGYQFCSYRDSDGAQIWCSHDFAPRQANYAALIPNFYAPAGQVLATLSLVLTKNSFYLKLEALNLKTGKTLWDTIPAFTKGTHSGISEGAIGALISGDSRTIYAVAGLYVYAYNASNGQVLWHIVKHVTGFPGMDGITGLAVG